MVQAIKADLASKEKKLLLVEGVDDKHAVDHIVHLTDKIVPFDIKDCGNDAAVLDALRFVVAGSKTTASVLGAVLDADSGKGVAARLDQIRSALKSAYNVPKVFPRKGMILKPLDTRPDRHRLPVIGVWLMPDNVQGGIFEDLLRLGMTTKSKEYVSAVVDKAKKDKMTNFREVELSKAIVRTHIAWQNPKIKNLGEAIRDSHFVNLAPACQPFLKWLERLFGSKK